MGYRKQRFAALFCAAAVIILGGCGDDLTQQIYIPGREDLAQPIGGYNATTQAGQTAEDSATGAQTGTASGGENATTSGSCHDSGDLTGERYTITISAAGDVTLGNHQEQAFIIKNKKPRLKVKPSLSGGMSFNMTAMAACVTMNSARCQVLDNFFQIQI